MGKKVFAVIFVCILILSLVLTYGIVLPYLEGSDNPSTDSERHFTWLYDFESHDWSTLAQQVKEFGFTDVFLSINARRLNLDDPTYNVTYEDQLVAFLNQFNDQGIATSFMILQDPLFCTEWDSTLVHLSGLKHFVGRNPTVPLKGIHLDTEPHASEDWGGLSSTDQADLFGSFMTLLTNVSAFVETHLEVELSAAVPWWFAERNFTSSYPGALVGSYDFLVFMVYGGVGSEVSHYSRVEDELLVIPGVLGIGVEEFSNESELLAFRSALHQSYQANPSYVGTSVYSFNKLLTLVN